MAIGLFTYFIFALWELILVIFIVANKIQNSKFSRLYGAQKDSEECCQGQPHKLPTQFLGCL